MGWPLPLHVLIKITRECKTDFLNASCLFFLSFLPTSFSCCFLEVPGLVVGDITTVAELERRRVGFLLLLRLLFRHPSERDFLFSLVISPLFLSLFFSLAGLLGLGTERSMMGQCWDENGKWMMAEGRLTANSEKEEQNDEDRMYAR